MGVGLGSCAKAQGSLLADIAVGLFLMPSPPASAGAGSSPLPEGEGTKGRPPVKGTGQYEDEEVSGTGLGRKLAFG